RGAPRRGTPGNVDRTQPVCGLDPAGCVGEPAFAPHSPGAPAGARTPVPLPVTAPLFIAGLGIVFVIVAIAWGRMHAFFALVLAAMLVGTLGAAAGLIDGYSGAVEQAMAELGSTAGKIAFVIVAAAVIGDCMTESGAASRIVDALLRLFGEPRAPVALLAAGFILSIPVFFDTVFILLLPLAREFARRSGGNFTHF